VDDLANGWFCEQLTSSLSALISPDDLFNFFDKLQGEVHMMWGWMDVFGLFMFPS
jgi:hypothetical protein